MYFNPRLVKYLKVVKSPVKIDKKLFDSNNKYFIGSRFKDRLHRIKDNSIKDFKDLFKRMR